MLPSGPWKSRGSLRSSRLTPIGSFRGFCALMMPSSWSGREEKDLTPVLQTDLYVAAPETPIGDLLTTAVNTRYPIAIQDEEGRLMGLLDRATILAEIHDEEDSAVTPLEEVLAEVNGNETEGGESA